MPKKNKKIFGVIENIYEYILELVECKFARNGLTNRKTFLTNVFENIIWHLFTGQSQQVVKITVTYPVQRFFVVEAFTCQLEEVNTKCEWKG